ncbi:MAG: exodeoxyribonuclease-3 [Planctomycetota bacterium]|jgi:exodeoxyribonuclease-3
MKIATWNVNSIRARLPRLLAWLESRQPDVVCLQETKVVDELFPRAEIEALGYSIECFGQKTYNGVAVLSRTEMTDVVHGFPDDPEDAQRRVLGVCVQGIQILNLYVVNGKEVGCDKYEHKLRWLEDLRKLVCTRYADAERLVLTGDFNITFDDRDVYDPDAWRDRILCSLPEREALARIMECGLTDVFRHFHEEGEHYTWWDYRTRGWARNRGLRIDHFLMSPEALKSCRAIHVDREERDGEKPSDHAPVIVEMDAGS